MIPAHRTSDQPFPIHRVANGVATVTLTGQAKLDTMKPSNMQKALVERLLRGGFPIGTLRDISLSLGLGTFGHYERVL
jgi:hypothetical protein